MTNSSKRQMVLTMFMLSFGYHGGAWRLPESRSEEIGGLSLLRDMAQAAERAKLHAIFFADSQDANPVRSNNNLGTAIQEPISALGALIGYTENIGLIGTMSTTFTEPYNTVRQLAGLDLMSDGRAGWNIVTSVMGHANFGLQQLPAPEQRYERATEFTEVALKLWDSWGSDTIINDRATGRWVDGAKIRDIEHAGKHFSVQGALNMPRPPQGRPLLVQAGQSEAGKTLGSRFADLIYTAQPDREKAIEFYADFKRRVKAAGRDPERVKILPGVMPVVGKTRAEAEELADELAHNIDEVSGRVSVERVLGAAVDDIGLDERIPAERIIDGPERDARFKTIYSKMAAEMTVREFMVALSRGHGHRWVVGTAAEVAETLIDWFDARASDGFNLNPPSVPTGMNNMLELLVPELQERGYFQHDYTGKNLRERVGAELFS